MPKVSIFGTPKKPLTARQKLELNTEWSTPQEGHTEVYEGIFNAANEKFQQKSTKESTGGIVQEASNDAMALEIRLRERRRLLDQMKVTKPATGEGE